MLGSVHRDLFTPLIGVKHSSHLSCYINSTPFGHKSFRSCISTCHELEKFQWLEWKMFTCLKSLSDTEELYFFMFQYITSEMNIINQVQNCCNILLFLSMPSGATMSSFWSHSNSSVNGVWKAYATYLYIAWNGLLSAFIYNENVPLEHPIPMKASLNLLCNFFVIFVLALLLPSSFETESNSFYC